MSLESSRQRNGRFVERFEELLRADLRAARIGPLRSVRLDESGSGITIVANRSGVSFVTLAMAHACAPAHSTPSAPDSEPLELPIPIREKQ